MFNTEDSIGGDPGSDIGSLRRQLQSERRARQGSERRIAQLEADLQLARAELTAANASQSDLVGRMEQELSLLRNKVKSGGDTSQMISLLHQQVETLQSELANVCVPR